MAKTPRGFSNDRVSYCPGAGLGWEEDVVGVNLFVPARGQFDHHDEPEEACVDPHVT